MDYSYVKLSRALKLKKKKRKKFPLIDHADRYYDDEGVMLKWSWERAAYSAPCEVKVTPIPTFSLRTGQTDGRTDRKPEWQTQSLRQAFLRVARAALPLWGAWNDKTTAGRTWEHAVSSAMMEYRGGFWGWFVFFWGGGNVTSINSVGNILN